MRRALGTAMAVGLEIAMLGVGAGQASALGCRSSLAPLQNLPGCNLNKTTLSGALALADSNLAGTNLNKDTVSGQGALLGSELRGADLNKAAITGADALIDSDLSGANLNGVDITAPAVGVAANLVGANLNNATIAGLGDLLSANLTGANLHGAALTGTGALTGANVTGANLRGATVTGLDVLFDAVYSHTTCPDGTNSDSDGGTCANHLNDPPAAAHLLPLAIPVGGGCTPGTPVQLVFLASPSGALAGASFPVSVAVEDASGCIETGDNSTSVSLALGASSPGGLSCSADPVTAGGGIADFSCTIGTAGTGYRLSATGDTIGNVTLGPTTSGSFDVSSPPLPTPPPPGTVLGGGRLNLDAYCGGYSHVPGIGRPLLNGGSNTEFGPDYAFDWFCVNGAGTTGDPIDIQAACNSQYGAGTVAYLGNPDDAYSWSCVSLSGATTTSDFTVSGGGYYGSFDGTTLLADGGLGGSSGLPDFVCLGADGSLLTDGLAGGGSVPDYVNTPGDGRSVTYSTPTGGFEVAGAGSLATGGAV